jgi:hypothetical protein
MKRVEKPWAWISGVMNDYHKGRDSSQPLNGFNADPVTLLFLACGFI